MGAKNKIQRMAPALMFLQCYHDEGDEFLDKIVTGDETWVKFVNVETKEQSQQWTHTHIHRINPGNSNNRWQTGS